MSRDFAVRVNAALVLGAEAKPVAVVTPLRIQAFSQTKRCRLRFVGPVLFAENLKRHLRRVVLPLVDRICALLKIRRRFFEISAVNIDAAASREQGVRITGFSIDAPLFLGLLASSCQIELADEFVATGHIASSHGDVRTVSNIAAKLTATRRLGSVSRFLHPVTDGSMDALSPANASTAASSLHKSRFALSLVPIQDVADLIHHAFAEQAIVLGSLRAGFFERLLPKNTASSPITEAAAHLSVKGTSRFFKLLRQVLAAGGSDAAQQLLGSYVDYHLRRRRYPALVGTRLSRTLASIPLAIIRLKIEFPLLNDKRLQGLSQRGFDNEDLALLKQVAMTAPEAMLSFKCPTEKTTGDNGGDASGTIALDHLLDELREETLAAKVDLGIDEARATYVLASLAVDNEQQFLHEITSFHTHLAGALCQEPVPNQAHALDLLTRAFADQGGFLAALREARSPRHGGLRWICDAMTEQLKREQREAHVFHLVHEAIDPADWTQRVGFLRAFVGRFPNAVPSELRHEPVERFAKSFDHILRAFIHASASTYRLAAAL